MLARSSSAIRPGTLSPSRLKKVDRDVACVKREARFVIYVDNRGALRLTENPRPRLNVLAVVGPAIVDGHRFPETILLEVGLWRTRPYHRASGQIPSRRKIADVDDRHLALLLPHIEELLIQSTRTRTDQWKSDPHWWLRAPERRLRRGTHLTVRERWRAFPRGVRFAASHTDQALITAILVTHAHSSIETAAAHARFANLCLQPYAHAFVPRGYFRDHANGTIPRLAALADSFERSDYGPHLYAAMRDHIDPDKQERFIQFVTELNFVRPAQLEASQVFLKYGPRFRNADLRLIPPRKPTQDHLVFELFPKPAVRQAELLVPELVLPEDSIPFPIES